MQQRCEGIQNNKTPPKPFSLEPPYRLVMKRFVLLLAALICMQVAVMAVPDSVTTGPYKISFDLGMSKDMYKVEIVDPKTKESLSGEVSTDYEIKLINKTGLSRRAGITLTSYEADQVVPAQEDLITGMKYVILQMDDMYDSEAVGRKIDGYDGVVATGTMKTSGYELKTYFATYYASSTMSIIIFSAYPWSEGTLSLLKTIHVERVA
jgi:hypothetical protein